MRRQDPGWRIREGGGQLSQEEKISVRSLARRGRRRLAVLPGGELPHWISN